MVKKKAKQNDKSRSYLRLIPQASLDLLVDSIARSLNFEKNKNLNKQKDTQNKELSFEQAYKKAKSLRIEERTKLSKNQLLEAIKALKFKPSNKTD